MKPIQTLLAQGMAMPFTYLLMLTVACALNPDFDVIHAEPRGLGRARANYPFVYDCGMVAIAFAGFLAGIGLTAAGNVGCHSLWDVLAGVSFLLASTGLAMAGLFPFPDQLHFGFGLTIAAALTPLFGALSVWRSADRSISVVLATGFF
jgi:hypothetical membrane protein